MVELIFWLSVAGVGYAYLGYPVGIALIAAVASRIVNVAPVRPSVSLVVVAHNEASVIARKLENCLALTYPANLLEIVVASDGSTDSTAELARCFVSRGVRVVEFDARRGKPAVLNDIVPRCRGEIVVLSDARQSYEADALAVLVESFADPQVGAVSGELHLVGDVGAPAMGAGIGLYWRYEKFIRRQESRLDSTVGATGAIYAIRRELFEPVPLTTVVDDVLIPLRIARRGYRVVFESRARAFDRVARTPREEFARKVRTIAGTLQLFARERWLWNPRANRLWVQTVSHKLLRILVPLLLGAMLASSALLIGSAMVYRLTLLGQLLFYTVAALGLSRRSLAKRRWVSIPYAFCLLNAAALVGIFRFMTGSQGVTWQKASDAEYA